MRPRTRIRTLLLLAAALAAAACATPYDPYRVPSAELRARVRTIALAPMLVNPNAAERATARERIEPLVRARLARGGFEVVPAEVWEGLWRTAAADVGDVFDPVSGKVDDERWKAVEAAVYHELAGAHGVDAVLRLRLDTVDVHLARKNVAYCGVQDAVYWPGSTFSVLETATYVLGSCLYAVLLDLDERELYGIRSGVELVETYARQTRAVRPQAERLADASRLREAVEATIGPLADGAAKR
jgi:hypothetical protein